ncbi:MAG: hypothetical protein U0802_11465 [Candidatus Binatia bacterium]
MDDTRWLRRRGRFPGATRSFLASYALSVVALDVLARTRIMYRSDWRAAPT